MVVVVPVIVVDMVVTSSGCVSMGIAMRIVVMFDRVAAGVTGMRAENGDQAGENCAQQRQKDNCLNHD